MKTVLVTNGQQRKSLAVVRSLGIRNLNVIVAEETIFNPSAFSKYCTKALRCPNAKKEPDKYYHWLKKTIIKYKCDVLFPMDDDVLEVVMKHSKEILSLCNVMLPQMESYFIANDKSNATKLAEKAQVSCPKTVYPRIMDNISGFIEGMQFPLVINRTL